MYSSAELATLHATAYTSLVALKAASTRPEAEAPGALQAICKANPALARSAVLFLLEIAEVEGRARAYRAELAEAQA